MLCMFNRGPRWIRPISNNSNIDVFIFKPSLSPSLSPSLFSRCSMNQPPRQTHSQRNTTTTTRHVPQPLDIPTIKTQSLQNRKTRKLILSSDNTPGLSVVLVSDPQSPTAGASLSVEVGSWHDGLEYPGTAHFLEHMLFLGTKKYPKENEYEQYIHDNNGTLNAYTANDHTVYYFSITPTKLQGALDRFAQFFIHPLFTESCVDRELNAIDQEYRKNIENDGWRALHVRKELSHQKHPYAGFNTGNRQTIGRIPPSKLHEWFKRNYSARLMNLVVMGRESLEELEQYVCSSFGHVPNSPVLPLPDEPSVQTLFDKMRGHWIHIVPIKELRELTISWEIPHNFSNLDSKPAVLLAHVLGHEGNMSLLEALKKEDLAEGLSASKSELGGSRTTFEISISLTVKGLQQRSLVVQRVFEALRKLKQREYPEYLVQEINNMAKVNWEFQQRSRDTALSYVKHLRREGITTFPQRTILIKKFDPTQIQQLMNLLTPNSCFVTLIAPHDTILLDDNWKTEKWMGARYQTVPFTNDEVQSWKSAAPHSQVDYPPPNDFIPTTLDLLPRSEQPVGPALIQTPTPHKLYHHLDTTFHVPESTLIFAINTPSIRPSNPRSLALLDLYLRFVHEALSPLAYTASCAGLSYSVSNNHNTGIVLSIDGYSPKQSLLLSKVLDVLKRPETSQEKFDIYKESILIDYRNTKKDSPLRQAFEIASQLIYKEYATPVQMAAEMETIALEELHKFINKFYKRSLIESFVGGNTHSENAHALFEQVQNALCERPCTKQEVERSRVSVPPSTPTIVSSNLEVKGNAVVFLLDLGPKSMQTKTVQDMLAKMINEPFYSELRTKQQTGYIVHSGSILAGNQRLFLQCSIQSNTHSPRDLLSRIELFLENFIRELPSMEARFNDVKTSTIARLQNPFDTLSGMNRFHYTLAFDEDGDFGYIPKRIEALKQFTFDEFKDSAGKLLGRDNLRRLSVLVHGNDPENKKHAYCEVSLSEFRARL